MVAPTEPRSAIETANVGPLLFVDSPGETVEASVTKLGPRGATQSAIDPDLYNETHKKLYRYLTGLCWDDETAGDITREVMKIGWEEFGFDLEDWKFGFLKTRAYSRWIDDVRKDVKRKAAVERLPVPLPDRNDEPGWTTEQYQAARELLKGLTPLRKRIVWLRIVLKWPAREVAIELGLVKAPYDDKAVKKAAGAVDSALNTSVKIMRRAHQVQERRSR